MPMEWAYGVTTVPHRRTTVLPRTLSSLAAGGFHEPRLFVDGCWDWRSWHEEFKLDATCRYPKANVYPSWALAIAELYFRRPRADMYAVFQDDFVTYRNLRQYLEWCKYPHDGYYNLYTFPSNQALLGPKRGWHPSNQKGKGAVALVFDREAVQVLLRSQELVERVQDADRGWRSIDGGVVHAMNKQGWREYVHNPSLVQHTGLKSSWGNSVQPLAPAFLGEEFDALELLSC